MNTNYPSCETTLDFGFYPSFFHYCYINDGDWSGGQSTPAGKATAENPTGSGFLPRKLKRCLRKATVRSANQLVATLRRNLYQMRNQMATKLAKKSQKNKQEDKLVIYLLVFFSLFY
ncbi:hypothetical protein [Aquibacillus halophilus]|uniref:hypothetical protein n=1 Tax=Aquibacillus halophilus TaxID=930132 RepID=UPI00196BB16F|nr:hypothetical protein [Aquibacillus halophilus]